MKPLTSRLSDNNWVVPVSLLCLVLGVLMRLAWVTGETRSERFQALPPELKQSFGTGSIDLQDEAKKLSEEVQRLRAENTKAEGSLANHDNSTKVLNDTLQDTKVFAGLTQVEGPGVLVTLRDSTKAPQPYLQEQIIHDGDVLRTVNELWNAGAEAVAVNGHRVVATTSIRCVGSTILVNNTPIAPPVEVRAIGDPKTIVGALEIPGGLLSEFRQTDPAMVSVQTVKLMTLPAFAGSTVHHFLKVPVPQP